MAKPNAEAQIFSNSEASILEQMKVVAVHHTSTPVRVVPIANSLGIEVYRASNWPYRLSGVIKRNADGLFDIYVNADHPGARRRFAIAHELAHCILHTAAIGNGIAEDALFRSSLPNSMEAEANRLAADILMPWHLLDPIIASGTTDIRRLAQEFNVSNSAMSIRLGVPYEDGKVDGFEE